MGWLFGRKKKVPKVPFPQGHLVQPGTLKFPIDSGEKIIEPNYVKEAAGLIEEKVPLKEQKLEPMPELPEEPMLAQVQKISRQNVPEHTITQSEPLFVKVDVYQRILGEITGLHQYLSDLSTANRGLENSEYNEEANFDKLRKSMKSLHDKLLQADNILFKT